MRSQSADARRVRTVSPLLAAPIARLLFVLTPSATFDIFDVAAFRAYGGACRALTRFDDHRNHLQRRDPGAAHFYRGRRNSAHAPHEFARPRTRERIAERIKS